MLAAFVVVLRSLAMLVCGHRAVALENLALRQQLAVFKRTVKRPPLHRRDRLLWIVLAETWRNWRAQEPRDGSFRDLDAHSAQFAMDPRRAPQRIRGGHLHHEGTQGRVRTRAARAGLP